MPDTWQIVSPEHSCVFALVSKGGEGWMPVAGRGGEGRLEVMGATSPAKWGLAQILGGNQNHYQIISAT